jgi:hypothetical protein
MATIAQVSNDFSNQTLKTMRTPTTTSKNILTIVIVIIFWMALWETIGLMTESWKKSLKYFFYVAILFCIIIFVSIRTDIIPHF